MNLGLRVMGGTRHRSSSSMIALLQSNAGGYASGATPQTSSAVGFTNNTTAGSLLVCVSYASASSAGTPTIEIPTTSGFTWTLAESAISSAGSVRVSIYYISNASSMATSTTTTVEASNLSGNVAVEFDLYEFSNIATSTPIDNVELSDNGSGTNPATATSLSTSATDLIIVAACGNGTNGTKGTNYTLGINASHQEGGKAGQMQYILNQAKGTIATSFAGGTYTTGDWGCAAVAFLPV